MNTKTKRSAAFLAAVIMSSTAVGYCPAGTQKADAKAPSVREFADSVLEKLPQHPDTAFESLCYNREKRTLLRDGEAVSGDSFSGFRVIDGELRIAASETVRAGETAEQKYLTIEEAAPLIGLETYESADGICVSNPFQSGTLIVKSDDLSDTKGASEIGSGWNDLHVLQYPTAADAYAAYQEYQKDDDVIFAEPDRIYHIANEEPGRPVSGYPYPSNNWGWDAVGADGFLTKYKESAASAPEIKVAVIDTGLYAEHDWFRGRVAEGGVSFVEDLAEGSADPHGHGTHCSGIICGMTPDNVKILPLRALNHSGYGASIGIYCAMMYAAEQDADVVSMSLGGLGASPMMEEAIRVLKEKDIPCVVAAGNDMQDAKYYSPAHVPDAITISSVSYLRDQWSDDDSQSDSSYWLSFYSNFGKGIDFAAPGEDIESASIYSHDSVISMSGTSMACPHAAGCVADILTLNNDLTVDEIYDCLRANAADLGTPGLDEKFGWGMVNIADLDFHHSELEKPEASREPGVFDEVFKVTLSTPEADAEIRYTLDGTVPDADTGILYTGEEILIENTTDLRAVTVRDGERSACARWHYVFYKEPPALYTDNWSGEVTVSPEDTTDMEHLYYTIDGSDPTPDNCIPFTGPVSLTESVLFKAVYIIGEYVSEPTVTYFIVDGQKSRQMFEVEDGVLTHYYGYNTERFDDDNVVDLNDYFEPGEITAIGDSAFRDAQGLAGVVLPDSVVSVGAHAFESCSDLCAVKGHGVEYVGQYSFRYCSLLTELDMPALKKVAPYAFIGAFNNRSNMMPIPADNQIEEIEANGFESSSLVNAEFPNLKKMGESAFGYCYDLETIKLPPNITVLPDTAFYECDKLRVLDAPGVTELGDFALFLDPQYASSLTECTIDFSKVTSIGTAALSIFHQPTQTDPVTFDSLTHIESNAFAYFPARELHLPALKEIPESAFAAAFCSAVYLEQAETFEENALYVDPENRNHITYIFGDHVSGDSVNPLSGSSGLSVAAPADSAMRRFAQAAGCDYYCTPDIYIRSGCGSVRQYDAVSFNDCFIPLAFGAHMQFTVTDTAYASGYEAPESPVITDTADQDMLLDTSVPGTVTVQADLLDDADTVLASKTLEFTIRPAETEDVMTEEGVFVFEWEKGAVSRKAPEELFAPPQIYGGYSFVFKPEKTGDYYFIPEEEQVGVSVLNGKNELISYTPIQDYIGEYASEPVKINAGEAVIVLAETGAESVLNNWYTGILVTQEMPYQGISPYQYTITPEQRFFKKGAEEPDLDALEIIDTFGEYDYIEERMIEKKLVPGVDYQMKYVQNGDAGTILIFGMGNFRGTTRLPVYFYEDYTCGDTVEIGEIRPGQTRCYHLKDIGRADQYFIGADYSESFLQQYAEGRIADAFGDNCPRITLMDSEMQECNADSSSYYFVAERVFSLDPNTDYYIMVDYDSYVLGILPSVAPEGMFALSMKPYDPDHWMYQCEADIPESIRYSGSKLNLVRSVTDPRGNELTEGRDYQVYIDNQTIPGFAAPLIVGIGDYYGMITGYSEITAPYIDEGPFVPETIRPNEPFRVKGDGGCFTLVTDGCYQGRLRITDTSDPDAFFIYTVNQYVPSTYSWLPVFSGRGSEEGELMDLLPGTYRIYISQNAAEREYILDAQKNLTDISGAEVHAETLYYTGEELQPEITLTYDGKILTDGTDYVLMQPAQPITECGVYKLTAAGIGTFCGERSVLIHVREQEDSALQKAVTGENTLAVTEPGQAVFCTFTTDETSCGISMNELQIASLTVYDTVTNTEVLALNGQGYLYGFFDVTPGREYLIRGAWTDPGHTGEIGFKLLTDYTDLTACTVEAAPQVLLADQLTAFTVKDGDTVLQQGVDYQIYYNGGNKQAGHAILSLIGAGNSIGELQHQYYLAPEPETDPDQYVETEKLSLGQTKNATIPMPGEMQRFAFKAPDDGRYSFSRPDPKYSGMCVFVYGPDMELLPLDANAADLKKGEKLLFIAVADILEDYLNPDGSYTLTVDKADQSNTLQIGDSVYVIRDGAAYLDQYDGENIGIQLPETVHDPEQDLDIPVKGYTPELIAALGSTRTFYCEQGSESYEFMFEMGVCFAVPDPQTGIRGDITGDGAVNTNDWLTLMRWLNENPGMLMSDTAYAAADMNEDGCLDLLDANAIMEIAAAEYL